jgi:CheY-like chemotaxis protein
MKTIKGRILIIEDEKYAEVLGILLEEEGYVITSASNGLEGIEHPATIYLILL